MDLIIRLFVKLPPDRLTPQYFGITWKQRWSWILTLGCTSKLIRPPWYKEGLMEPSLGFCYVTAFQKVFTFSRKPVMCSTRWGIHYRVWHCGRPLVSSNVSTILAAILDFTKIENLTGKGESRLWVVSNFGDSSELNAHARKWAHTRRWAKLRGVKN